MPPYGQTTLMLTEHYPKRRMLTYALQHLSDLPQLKTLRLRGRTFCDLDMADVAKLKNLESLRLVMDPKNWTT